MPMLPEPVVLIGAGNVGYHLGRRLHDKGVRIAQVFSRDLRKAQDLALVVGSEATDQLQAVLSLDTGLYLIAVKDDAIEEVAGQLQPLVGAQCLIAHTSGTVSSTVLQPYFARSGVFYPLQTFSRDRVPDFSQIPFCVYAADEEVQEKLLALAHVLSDKVYPISDQERQVLHVAAVFVNNFSNYLFGIGHQLLSAEGLSFDLLRPLILETAAKVMEHDPDKVQTGPAKRGDQLTILSHLRYLQQYPEYQNLYRLISYAIQSGTTRKNQ